MFRVKYCFIYPPHRHRSTPEAVSCNTPISCIFKPFAKLPVLHMLWYPMNLLIQLAHSVLEIADFDIPTADCLVNQRCISPPTMRIIM